MSPEEQARQEAESQAFSRSIIEHRNSLPVKTIPEAGAMASAPQPQAPDLYSRWNEALDMVETCRARSDQAGLNAANARLDAVVQEARAVNAPVRPDLGRRRTPRQSSGRGGHGLAAASGSWPTDVDPRYEGAPTMTIQISDRSLPPSEAIPVPEIREAIENYARAKTARSKASQEATVLVQTRARAVEADNELYADAIAAGKKDPGTPATDDHDKAIKEAERKAAALERLVQRAYHDLVVAMDENSDALAEAAQKRLAETASKLLERVESLGAAVSDRQSALALASFTKTGRWKAGHGSSVPIRRDRVGVKDVLSAIARLAEQPQDRTEDEDEMGPGGQPMLVEFAARVA